MWQSSKDVLWSSKEVWGSIVRRCGGLGASDTAVGGAADRTVSTVQIKYQILRLRWAVNNNIKIFSHSDTTFMLQHTINRPKISPRYTVCHAIGEKLPVNCPDTDKWFTA